MKKRNFVLFVFALLAVVSCKKDLTPSEKSPEFGKSLKGWEDVIPSSTFNSRADLEKYWNYLYPWGATHNGSAKMVCSSTNNSTLYLESAGILDFKAYPVSGQGNIHYYSATIWAKAQVLVNDQYPNWEVKCDFQCPSARGTWPALWLTGTQSWPPESDIMEFKGNSNCWQNTFRTSSDVTSTITTVSSPGNWHTYRVWITKVDATNINIHYYIDGVWKAVHTANFVGKPMWIIIDFQTEGSSGTPGPSTATYLKARNFYVGRTKAY